MQYLIDSDAVSALTSGEATIQKYFSSLGEGAVISLCILTIYEFEFSISACTDLGTKSRIEKSLQSLKSHFSIVGLGFEDAKIYGNLKAKLRDKTGIDQKTLKRHNLDIALASVSIANDCIVVSRDKIFKNHLQKIDNRLRCESW